MRVWFGGECGAKIALSINVASIFRRKRRQAQSANGPSRLGTDDLVSVSSASRLLHNIVRIMKGASNAL